MLGTATATPPGNSSKYFIREVPIFSAGVRDGVYYSIEDIDAIVANHQLTHRTWMPAAGLGHYGDGASLLGDLERRQVKPTISFKQVPLIWPNLNKLGCSGTAEPAVGWITKLWRIGRTLWARVEDIPEVVARMLKDKLFRYVSAEVYQRPPDGIPGEGCFLHGMGFLGKTPPEVKTLGEVPTPELQAFSQSQTVSQSRQLSPATIVSQLSTHGLRVFSEVKIMDLNQLATNLKLSPDAVKALGTLPPADQDALKLALAGSGAGGGWYACTCGSCRSLS